MFAKDNSLNTVDNDWGGTHSVIFRTICIWLCKNISSPPLYNTGNSSTEPGLPLKWLYYILKSEHWATNSNWLYKGHNTVLILDIPFKKQTNWAVSPLGICSCKRGACVLYANTRWFQFQSWLLCWNYRFSRSHPVMSMRSKIPQALQCPPRPPSEQQLPDPSISLCSTAHYTRDASTWAGELGHQCSRALGWSLLARVAKTTCC